MGLCAAGYEGLTYNIPHITGLHASLIEQLDQYMLNILK